MIRRSHMLTTAALLAVCAAPAYADQDLRSPDARDAARAAATRDYVDLRSPDARDAARASAETSYQDLRSPDARDAGQKPRTVQVPEPVVEIRENPGSGFDWGDAGIGAAGLLALLSIAGGVTLLAIGRRRRRDLGAPAH
jgi:hypothetical protein